MRITIRLLAARAVPLALALGLGACAQHAPSPSMAGMPGMMGRLSGTPIPGMRMSSAGTVQHILTKTQAR
ncbi:MAG: hypothetical protein M3Y41_20830 [Pseudomonadota bacterium]|nr:hypothetical protein [Pseudomonadota bacterium]